MKSTSYVFNSVKLDTSDGVLENLFNIPGYPKLDLSKYKIESIPKYCFFSNSNITEVILPNTLKYIGANCFSNCYNIEKFNIPPSVEELESSLIQYSNIYDDTSNWENGVFYKDGWAINKNNITVLNIREGTEKIANSFASINILNKTLLTSLTLPTSLKIIGKSAFHNQSSLQKLTIPKNVRKIYQYAFAGCSGVERLELYADIDEHAEIISRFDGTGNASENSKIFIGKNVKKLPYGMFASSKLYNIEFESGTTFEIFGKNSFAMSSIKSIIIPSTVKEIGVATFYSCSLLQNISFDGTVSDWNKIQKGTNWALNIPAKYVQCIDGQVTI